MKVSLRFHNDTYAPGIATYGIDGKTGEQGLPGTSMFFTDYSLPDGLSGIALKITSRKLPIITEETILDRRYVNGDLFVDLTGKIYKLIDIDTLSIDSGNGSLTTFNSYFEYVGEFGNTAIPFTDANVNAVSKQSLTISDIAEQGAETDTLLSLIKKDDNSEMSFIDMQAIFENAPNVDFNIRFDKGYNAFVLDSQYPILINSNVFVNMGEDFKQLSGYSPVVTADNTITEFVGSCRECTYDADASIYSYSKVDSSTLYYGCIYKIILNDSENTIGNNDQTLDRYYADKNVMIHFLNGSFLDFLNYRVGESIYYFKQNYDEVKLNNMITRIKYMEFPLILVSLVQNVECYLQADNKTISGLNEN